MQSAAQLMGYFSIETAQDFLPPLNLEGAHLIF